MVSSGGGGNYQQPAQPTPAGQITGFGSATPWAPSYTSVLGSGWATPGSIDAGLAAAPAQAALPPPTAAAGPAMNPQMLRQMLTQLMNPPNTPQQQQALRIATMPGGQYSGGGPVGAASGMGGRGGSYGSSRSSNYSGRGGLY